MLNSTKDACTSRENMAVHQEGDLFHVGSDGTVHFTDNFLQVPAMTDFCVDQSLGDADSYT